jgi:uncharacterized membrane protein HdeD (DUF308 family)
LSPPLAENLPVIATLAIERFAGWLFLIGGIVGLFGVFTARNIPGVLWTLVAAALAVLVGLYLLWHPLTGLLSLTIGLAAFFVAQGIAQIVGAFEQRRVLPDSWIWALVTGLANLSLAAIILLSWPDAAAWTLGVLVGVNLFLSGLSLIMTSIACRSSSGVSGPAKSAA